MSKNLHFENKIVLVTGASRGIGRALARELVVRGAHVVALARTVGALEELDDELIEAKAPGKITLTPLDLRDRKAVHQLGIALMQRFGRLDALVGNAAVTGPLTPIADTTEKHFQDVLEVNLTANWGLLRTCEPLLNAAKSPRICMITSTVARNPQAFWGAYAISKAALETMVQIYAREHLHKNIRANLYNPGAVATAMRKAVMPGELQDKLSKPEDVIQDILGIIDESQQQNGQLFSRASHGNGEKG